MDTVSVPELTHSLLRPPAPPSRDWVVSVAQARVTRAKLRLAALSARGTYTDDASPGPHSPSASFAVAARGLSVSLPPELACAPGLIVNSEPSGGVGPGLVAVASLSQPGPRLMTSSRYTVTSSRVPAPAEHGRHGGEERDARERHERYERHERHDGGGKKEGAHLLPPLVAAAAPTHGLYATVLYVDGGWSPVLVDARVPLAEDLPPEASFPLGLGPTDGDIAVFVMERAMARVARDGGGYTGLSSMRVSHVLEMLTGGAVLSYRRGRELGPGVCYAWEGSTTNGTDVESIAMWLSIVGGEVCGGGSDAVGPFSVTGTVAVEEPGAAPVLTFDLIHTAVADSAGSLTYRGVYDSGSGTLAGTASSELYPGYVMQFTLRVSGLCAAELGTAAPVLFPSLWDTLQAWWDAGEPLVLAGPAPHLAFPVVDVAMVDGEPALCVACVDPLVAQARLADLDPLPGLASVLDTPAHAAWIPLSHLGSASALDGYSLLRTVLLESRDETHVRTVRSAFVPQDSGAPRFDPLWLPRNPQYTFAPREAGVFVFHIAQPESRRHTGRDSYPIGVGFRVYVAALRGSTVLRDPLDAHCIATGRAVAGERTSGLELALAPLDESSGLAYVLEPYATVPGVTLPYVLRVAGSAAFTLRCTTGPERCGSCSTPIALGMVMAPGAVSLCDVCYYTGQDDNGAYVSDGAAAGSSGGSRQSRRSSQRRRRQSRRSEQLCAVGRIASDPLFCHMCATELVGEAYECMNCPSGTVFCPLCLVYFNSAVTLHQYTPFKGHQYDHGLLRINVLETCAGCGVTSFAGDRYECVTCAEENAASDDPPAPALVLCGVCVARRVVARPGHDPVGHVYLKGCDDEGSRWRAHVPNVGHLRVGREPALLDDGIINYGGTWVADGIARPFRALLTQIEAPPPPKSLPPDPIQYNGPSSGSDAPYSVVPPWSASGGHGAVNSSELSMPPTAFPKDTFVDGNDEVDLLKQWFLVLRPLTLLAVAIHDALASLTRVGAYHNGSGSGSDSGSGSGSGSRVQWTVASDPTRSGMLYFVPSPESGLDTTWTLPAEISSTMRWALEHPRDTIEDPLPAAAPDSRGALIAAILSTRKPLPPPPPLPPAGIGPSTRGATRGASRGRRWGAGGADTAARAASGSSGSGITSPSRAPNRSGAGPTVLAAAHIAVRDGAATPAPGALRAAFDAAAERSARCGRGHGVGYAEFRSIVSSVLGIVFDEAVAVRLYQDLDPGTTGLLDVATFVAAVEGFVQSSELA